LRRPCGRGGRRWSGRWGCRWRWSCEWCGCEWEWESLATLLGSFTLMSLKRGLELWWTRTISAEEQSEDVEARFFFLPLVGERVIQHMVGGWRWQSYGRVEPRWDGSDNSGPSEAAGVGEREIWGTARHWGHERIATSAAGVVM
jgi:hypothetical protein